MDRDELIEQLSTRAIDTIASALEQIEANGKDDVKAVTRIVNAIFAMGEFHGIINILEDVEKKTGRLDRWISVVEGTKSARERIYQGIKKNH